MRGVLKSIAGVAALVVGLAALLAGGASFVVMKNVQTGAPAVLYALGVGLMGAGAWLMRLGRQLLARSADSIRDGDGDYVVYLRSFKSDADANRAAADRVKLLPTAMPAALASEEEQIVLALSRIGPTVAIGRPGEKLPQLGALRAYVSDDEWQDKVGNWVSRAALVLMRVGDTGGFWWEVAHVTDNVDPTRVVLLLPDNAADFETFRERVSQHLPHPLPDFTPRGAKERSFGGLLWFDRDWRPCITPCADIINVARYPVAADLAHQLEPVFGRLGFAKLERGRWTARILASLVDLAITLGLLFGSAFLTDLTSSGLFFSIALAPAMLHPFVFELLPRRASLGKRLFSLMVTDVEGYPAPVTQALYRVTFKVFCAVISPLALVSLVRMSRGGRPLHDVLTGADLLSTRRQTRGLAAPTGQVSASRAEAARPG